MEITIKTGIAKSIPQPPPTIQLSPTEAKGIEIYRRLKGVEKRVADKLGKRKAQLLELAGNLTGKITGEKVEILGEHKEAVFIYRGSKVLSITDQGRGFLDVEKLKSLYPAAYQDCYVPGEENKNLVVRLH